MQNFTTASLKGHRDIEEQILRLQNYINGSRYTVAITGAGISMAAGIMDFAHMNFPLVLQMSSSAVLKSAPNHYYNTARKRLYDTSELEAERIQLQDEMNIVAEMIQQCVNENARVALDQAEYQKKYDGLADRFDRIKERLEAVGIAITERMAKREKTERFLAELEKRDGSLTEFDEEDWYSLVEYATVYSREDIRFTFKNGMEIKA